MVTPRPEGQPFPARRRTARSALSQVARPGFSGSRPKKGQPIGLRLQVALVAWRTRDIPQRIRRPADDVALEPNCPREPRIRRLLGGRCPQSAGEFWRLRGREQWTRAMHSIIRDDRGRLVLVMRPKRWLAASVMTQLPIVAASFRDSRNRCPDFSIRARAAARLRSELLVCMIDLVLTVLLARLPVPLRPHLMNRRWLLRCPIAWLSLHLED